MGRRVALSILKLETAKIGGIEMYLRESAEQLHRARWDSVVYLPTMPGPQVCEYLLAVPNSRIEAVPALYENSFAAHREFVRALRKYRPAAVHLQFSIIQPLFPWLARWHGVRHFFYTDHQSRQEGEAKRIPPARRFVTRVLFEPVTARIAVSDYINETNRLYGGLPSDRYIRIYNGVDVERAGTQATGAAYRRRMRIPEDALVVAQVSQMIPEKGYEDLLAAAEEVLEADPRVYFLLVGEGPQLEEIRAKAAAMRHGERVKVPGASPDPMREGVFAAADVVSQVSRWNEAFGYAIAEAMAHAKPVVATRVGGIPELVQDGVTGFLVERQKPEEIAASLLPLLRDPALCARFGQAGRLLVLERFHLRTLVADTLRLYELEAGTNAERPDFAKIK